MTRASAALASCLLIGALAPSPALAVDDGINLLLNYGASQGSVALQWTGGEITFEVFRSSAKNDVVLPAHKLGETNLASWNDSPPAGTIFYYVVTGGLDRVPPAIAATPTPDSNAYGWNNSDVLVTFQCSDAGSGIATCPDPVLITAEGAGQQVSGTAFDQTGNSASTTISVSLDRTPPVLDITAPSGTITGTPSPAIGLQYSDALSGVLTSSLQISVDGAALAGCAAGPGGASCVPPALVSGDHTVSSSLVDRAGNVATDGQPFSLRLANALGILVTQPAGGLLTNATVLTVSGTVSPQADLVMVNGVLASVQGGAFSAVGVPLVEGSNTITAVATNSAGDAGSSSITVVRDTSPPTVVIESPASNQIVTGPAITVVGLVNDVVTGTVGARNCQVTIAGRAGSVTAAVGNRSFMARDVPLVPGPNVLTAIATDAAGNTSQPFPISISRQPPVGQSLRVFSGNDQSGTAGAQLSQPLVVTLTDSFGTPLPGRLVTFSVARGDGTLSSGASSGRSLVVASGPGGQAQVMFTLGTRSGLGGQRVRASAIGFLAPAEFIETALAGPPAGIKAFDFDHLRGVAGRRLPSPFTVFVHDFAGNPVSGAPVTFQISGGGGNIDGAPAMTATTDDDGRVQVVLTLGPEAGINNNVLQASVPGVGTPVLLIATGTRIGARSETRVSGVVLDNSNVPVPGVTMRILGTGLTAVTNDQGWFSIADAPVATVTLEADGSTATRPGVWPMLHFKLTTISGQDNTIGMPIYLLTIDTPGGRVVGGPQDVTLTMADVPGLELTVFANSVTCLDGSHQCAVSISQVHNDKVPMPPLDGAAPSLIWTVQPPGTRFNPPARVTYPNVDGLPPGAVTEILSFDHDLGQYVSVGTATVQADGSVITSDPGGGIAHAGWGYPRPAPIPIFSFFGCDDGNPCNGVETSFLGFCISGSNAPLCTACTPAGLVCDGQGGCRPGRDIVSQIANTLSITYVFDEPFMEYLPGNMGFTLCRAGNKYRITQLSSTCDSVDMVGSTVTESAAPVNLECALSVKTSPKVLYVGTGGKMNSTDKYAFQFPVSDSHVYYTCTDTWIQSLLVNGVVAQRQRIENQYTISGFTCSSVTTITVLPH